MLNEYQKALIRDYLYFPLDTVGDLENITDRIYALKLMLSADEISIDDKVYFDLLELYGSIQDIRKILIHDSPQNITFGCPYMGGDYSNEGIKDGYVYFRPIGNANGTAREKVGLLSLTAKDDVMLKIKDDNDKGKMPYLIASDLIDMEILIENGAYNKVFEIKYHITKDDVVNYVRQIISEEINKLQKDNDLKVELAKNDEHRKNIIKTKIQEIDNIYKYCKEKSVTNAHLCIEIIKVAQDQFSSRQIAELVGNMADSDPSIASKLVANKLSSYLTWSNIKKLCDSLHVNNPDICVSIIDSACINPTDKNSFRGTLVALYNPIDDKLSDEKLDYLFEKYPDIRHKAGNMLVRNEITSRNFISKTCLYLAEMYPYIMNENLLIEEFRNKIPEFTLSQMIQDNKVIAEFLFDQGNDFLNSLKSNVLYDICKSLRGNTKVALQILTNESLREKIMNFDLQVFTTPDACVTLYNNHRDDVAKFSPHWLFQLCKMNVKSNPEISINILTDSKMKNAINHPKTNSLAKDFIICNPNLANRIFLIDNQFFNDWPVEYFQVMVNDPENKFSEIKKNLLANPEIEKKLKSIDFIDSINIDNVINSVKRLLETLGKSNSYFGYTEPQSGSSRADIYLALNHVLQNSKKIPDEKIHKKMILGMLFLMQYEIESQYVMPTYGRTFGSFSTSNRSSIGNILNVTSNSSNISESNRLECLKALKNNLHYVSEYINDEMDLLSERDERMDTYHQMKAAIANKHLFLNKCILEYSQKIDRDNMPNNSNLPNNNDVRNFPDMRMPGGFNWK